MRHLQIILFIFCIIFYAPSIAISAEPESEKKISIRVSKNSPRVHLLGREFIFIGDVELPEKFANIRSKWQGILDRHNQDVFMLENIPLPKLHKEQWAALSKLLLKMKPMDKLRNINGFFNSIPSREDSYSYNADEYWATPHEFLQTRGGDCEDYAIAKFFALQHFSWEAEKLWLVFLHDNINDGLHVVLSAHYDDKKFILDNLSKPVQLLIPEEQYAKQVKIFALLNMDGMWMPIQKQSK